MTFEYLKRLEGEVLNALAGFGETQSLLNLSGRTTKAHHVTGEQVPDDAAQVTMLRYLGARKAQWPEAVLVSQAGGCPCFP